MQFMNVYASPKELLDPEIGSKQDANSRAELDMVTICIELELRAPEFMALLGICGANNVEVLKETNDTEIEVFDADLGNLISEHCPESTDILEKNPATKLPYGNSFMGLFGAHIYHCVATFRGQGIRYLCGRNPGTIFTSKGNVDENAVVIGGLLPSIYRELSDDIIAGILSPIDALPVYNCVIKDNEVITRYVSNGIATIDCTKIDVDELKKLKMVSNSKQVITQLCRLPLQAYMEIIANRGTCIGVMAHEPLYRLVAEHSLMPEIDDPDYSENELDVRPLYFLPASTQITFVLRIMLPENWDNLTDLPWFKEGHPVYDNLDFVLRELKIFG